MNRSGVFVGEVTGHPLLKDGWIITSPVRWISDDWSCARTESRLYKLGDEFPHDQPLPEKPRSILFTRLLGNFGELFGTATLEQFGKLMNHADRERQESGISKERHGRGILTLVNGQPYRVTGCLLSDDEVTNAIWSCRARRRTSLDPASRP